MNTILRDCGYDIVAEGNQIDPETEDLLYGEELENGMVVLVEGRYRIPMEQSYYDNEAQKIDNRWCEVTKIRKSDDNVTFIGVYADGRKAVRSYGKLNGWIVKISSIPAAPEHPSSESKTFQNYLLGSHTREELHKSGMLRLENS